MLLLLNLMSAWIIEKFSFYGLLQEHQQPQKRLAEMLYACVAKKKISSHLIWHHTHNNNN
jgi:hypothetical protein